MFCRFVTFEKEESVDTVMKLEHEIMGKYVETKRAEPRDSRYVQYCVLCVLTYIVCYIAPLTCVCFAQSATRKRIK